MDQPILASKFHQCSMDFFQSILPSEHPQFKQTTDNQMPLSIGVNEATDSLICEYYLPITQKVSRYAVEFENETAWLTVQPLETLYDIKLKIKELYPEHNEIDCFIIDEKGTKVRHFICRTQTSIIINVDPDATIGHNPLQLRMNSSDRIEDLQDKIEEITKIPFYHQILQYQEENLFAYKLLSDYKIENNSIVVLKQHDLKNTTVYINIVSVYDDPFRFERNLALQRQTVFDLKKYFENLLGIPFDNQELSYNDTILNEDEQFLQYYEIQEKTNLTLTLKQCCVRRKISIEYSDIHIFEIESYKTIEELKKLIEKQLNLESKYQNLTMNHMELKDNQFVNTIIRDSQLKLIDRRLITVQIYIRYQIQEFFIKQKYENDDSEDTVDYKNDLKRFLLTKQNISIPLSVKLGDTIKDVKQLIEEKENICIQHQTLLLEEDKKDLCETFYNSQSLIDCNITDQTTLTLRLGDLAIIFLGTGEEQQGPFFIEMIDKEGHLVSNIKMKLAKRYNIIDIDNQLNDITLDSMEEIYMKILYTYKINTLPIKQSCRYNQLSDLSKQIRLLTQILLTHEHFYLPFLLIPN
ncbi:unnamed protein product [Adineta steineri]|uniref:Ubiquitin-like domain-containing protein n=1 Tax=Adineta steineri TaxID=433720 RepID=A0A813XER8_9BILA|nr:unnamed protein product [Adineta steineri]